MNGATQNANGAKTAKNLKREDAPSYASVAKDSGNGTTNDSSPTSSGRRKKHADVLDTLAGLHSDEIVHLAWSDKLFINKGEEWITTIWTYIKAYVVFLVTTWSQTFQSVFAGHFDPVNIFGLFLFASGASGVLFVLLIWCILAHSPVLTDAFYAYSAKFGSSLSLVNCLSNIFRELSPDEAVAGKAALSKPPPANYADDGRQFDLDAAKVLLQLASLMYERGTRSTNSAIAKTRNHLKETNYPKSSKRSLSALLDPGHLMKSVLGDVKADEISHDIQNNDADNAIREFTRGYGIEYAPVSELNSVSSAYAAIFWDAKSNWIVAAFKGTSPTEYDEWVSDFNYILASAAAHIKGFGKVHRGFLQRMFPDTVQDTGAKRPYETIAHAIRVVASELLQNVSHGENVNVWFTGHSLGCATATLAYSKAIVDGFGDRVVVRDAYLFAAPICCDIETLEAFNEVMASHPEQPKTLWRITNREDAVATALPAFGDQGASILSSDNIFMFCHLGVEVKMRSRPQLNRITGSSFKPGTSVKIYSSLDPHIVGAVSIGKGLNPLVLAWQDIPLIGRLVQHGTTFYWDQLQRVGVGSCEWIKN